MCLRHMTCQAQLQLMWHRRCPEVLRLSVFSSTGKPCSGSTQLITDGLNRVIIGGLTFLILVDPLAISRPAMML